MDGVGLDWRDLDKEHYTHWIKNEMRFMFIRQPRLFLLYVWCCVI
jgi:hypothetical protein